VAFRRFGGGRPGALAGSGRRFEGSQKKFPLVFARSLVLMRPECKAKCRRFSQDHR
jgi:hypothetical protein